MGPNEQQLAKQREEYSCFDKLKLVPFMTLQPTKKLICRDLATGFDS